MVAKKAIQFLTIAALFLGSFVSYAGDGIEGAVDTPEEINAYKKHHLKDSHDFNLYRKANGDHVGFPLPIILWDGGLQVFSSGEFHNENHLAEVNGNFYKLHHEKIYKTDAFGTLKNEAGVAISGDEHPVNEIPLDLSITKSVVGMLLTVLLMIWMFGSLAKSYKKGAIPTGVGRFLEPLVLYVRDEIARPNIGEKKYKRYMPYLLTVFFFIWILNLLGMTPFGFTVTNQISVTVCLAMFTFIIVNISGNKDYWGHIFWMPGVPVPMKIILAPIEVLGMFTKPFSLLIRLFANITAGHVVVMSLIALTYTMQKDFGTVASFSISTFLTLFISLIELLVAFLQAFIFTMLSALFIGMSTEEHAHH